MQLAWQVTCFMNTAACLQHMTTRRRRCKRASNADSSTSQTYSAAVNDCQLREVSLCPRGINNVNWLDGRVYAAIC